MITDNVVLYFHGMGGNAEEANHFKNIFKNCDVVGIEYTANSPQKAKLEFPKLFDSACKNYKSATIIANSIGAYFVMNALSDKNINKAFFISPIVNMEKLIKDMMLWSNVSEEKLKSEGEIETEFGQTLSWEYLSYVRSNTINWRIPTHILYGEKDNLTSFETVSEFANNANATLTVMKDGEHWFHTEKQMSFLDKWIESYNS